MMEEVAVRIVGRVPYDWIMAPAQLVDFNIYTLLDFPQPSNCELEFQPGNLVTTLTFPDARGNDVVVAQRLYR
jgi:hypothetical protein